MSMRSQGGFNLIEVLIAVVVLTLGLLGVAAMQLTGIRNSQGSYYRSQATTIMNDMAERIYANTAGANSYNRFDSTGSSCNTVPTSCSMTSASVVGACTSVQMAADDLYAASCGANGANRLLPSGSLQVRCVDDASGVIADCVSGYRIQINVVWTELGVAGDGAASAITNAASQVVSTTIQP